MCSISHALYLKLPPNQSEFKAEMAPLTRFFRALLASILRRTALDNPSLCTFSTLNIGKGKRSRLRPLPSPGSWKMRLLQTIVNPIHKNRRHLPLPMQRQGTRTLQKFPDLKCSLRKDPRHRLRSDGCGRSLTTRCRRTPLERVLWRPTFGLALGFLQLSPFFENLRISL